MITLKILFQNTGKFYGAVFPTDRRFTPPCLYPKCFYLVSHTGVWFQKVLRCETRIRFSSIRPISFNSNNGKSMDSQTDIGGFFCGSEISGDEVLISHLALKQKKRERKTFCTQILFISSERLLISCRKNMP